MKKLLYSLGLLFFLAGCGQETPKETTSAPAETVEAGEVNVYTHRYYDADKTLFKRFEELTGIKVNVKSDKADKLIALLQSESNSPADVLITVDAGRLHYAQTLGLLQPASSPDIEANIPANLRHPEGYWHAMTRRSRVIIYNTENVDPATLSTYMDLADPKWKGKIAIRSSSNIYNQSLLSGIIANHGEEKALEWANGVVANMVAPPKGNDRDQIKKVALGEADLAVANTYYLGKLLNSDNELEQEAGSKVSVFFPSQEAQGAHINVSGIGVTKNAPNKENAIKLIEFLTGEEAQKVWAESNYEYPVNPKVQPSALLQSWGEFKADGLDLTLLGENNQKAIEVFEAAGWE